MNGWLIGAGFHGAMAVAFGAWASHGAGSVIAEDAVEWVRTGSSYQLWHAAALIAVAALAAHASNRLVKVAGFAFCLGALLFSCSLYALALGGPAWLVYLTPVGGSLLIAGWIALLCSGIFGQRAAI